MHQGGAQALGLIDGSGLTDLAALEKEEDAAEQDVRAAAAGRLPTVTLSAGYNTAFSSASELGFGDQLDQRRGGSLSLVAADAQLKAAELALQTSRERYRVGAATLLEVTQARATQVQAASAVVSARYNLVLQRTLISYYVGDLDPANAALR
ncbi:MAG TPA: TolC family protein [Longimicrobium sp.]|nr:TolC family protein [Longimicrobium sp.]